MNFKELLETISGLSDEQKTAIIEGMKSNKIYTAGEENLDLRYNKLKGEHDGLVAEHEKSKGLIAELQKSTKDNEKIQGKISEYESTIESMKTELEKEKTQNALKLGLISAGAKTSDVDYLMFKISNDPDFEIKLDDNGGISGLDDKLKGLKTQFPNQFEGSANKKIEEKKLEHGDDNKSSRMTKDEFNKLGYKSRVKLRETDPELYNSLI